MKIGVNFLALTEYIPPLLTVIFILPSFIVKIISELLVLMDILSLFTQP